ILAFVWFPRPLFSRRTTSGSDAAGEPARSMDPVGAVLLGLAVLAVLFPFVETSVTPWIWALLPVSVALGYAWVRWERRYRPRGRSPMVDLTIFATRSFRNGSIIMTLYFLGMTSIWVLIAMYFQNGEGHTALQAGSVGIPAALISAGAAHWAGRRVAHYGRKVVIGGLLFAVAGLV